MKNMIELPKPSDFFKCTLIDAPPQRDFYVPQFEAETILKRKGIVNFRNVIDMAEYIYSVNVIDEEKYEQYEKDMAAWNKLHGIKEEHVKRGFATQVIRDYDGPEQPVCPTKTVSISCSLVLYFIGIQRIVDTPFMELRDIYLKYLEKQKLDIE